MGNIVCVLGVERSGSTRTCSILSGFERLYAKNEIFNARGAFSLQNEFAALAANSGIADVTDLRDPRLVSWIRNHPNATVDWLLTRSEGRALTFKLFPDQIANPVEKARLLTREDIVFLILRRRPIDIYISALKAHATDQMFNVDTSGIRVRGDVNQFLTGLTRMRNWYDSCGALIQKAGRPCATLSFEDEIAQPDPTFIGILRDKLCQLGADPGVFVAVKGKRIIRQDTGRSYEPKMSNWKAFSEKLKRYPEYFSAFLE